MHSSNVWPSPSHIPSQGPAESKSFEAKGQPALDTPSSTSEKGVDLHPELDGPTKLILPIVGKRRGAPSRDLDRAITLRPADVFSLYGIPASTLHGYCNHPNLAKRLPSILLPGRKGRRGVRLSDSSELRAWMGKHRYE